jgi:sigma-B regulation protein RsbU (phosphoserine phosphatase)
MRILVSDDDRVSRRIVERFLASKGYEVLCAEDGSRALEILESDPGISLVVTDWMMPGLDGPELCRRARAIVRDRYLPIILLTSKAEKQDLVEGLNAGADAFLSKPLDLPELTAHIRVAERIIRLENQLARQLEVLREIHDRTEEDLKAASEVQRSLLPSSPPEFAGFEFSWVYEACASVAGDMFNVFRLDEDHVGLYVLDVSGHGVQAALLSVSLSRVLTPSPQQGGVLKRVSAHGDYEIVSPAEVASELNRRFPVMEQSNQFFTFLYGILHVPSRQLCFVRAGHPGLLWLHDGEVSVHSGTGGIAIGVIEDADYEEEILDLKAGDRILIHTDGLDEAANASGEQFGVERIIEFLKSKGSEPIERIVQGVAVSVHAFSAEMAPRDDITVVGVGVL